MSEVVIIKQLDLMALFFIHAVKNENNCFMDILLHHRLLKIKLFVLFLSSAIIAEASILKAEVLQLINHFSNYLNYPNTIPFNQTAKITSHKSNSLYFSNVRIINLPLQYL